MNLRIKTFIFLVLVASFASGQMYITNNTFYNGEVERINLANDSSKTFFNQHLSLKPILDQRTYPDTIFNSHGKHYYTVTQKLFKENLIIFKGDGFWCSIDPILDLEMGSDFSADTTKRLYWNTRGIRVQGKFLGKVGFSTTIYENQAIVPNYQGDYSDAHGEYFPNATNTKYNQVNAVIPGYGRTKPFKVSGYDFAFAQGTVSYVPNKHLNFHLGNDNHFIGNGYRSLLLSDFTVNYPFAKFEANFWDGRIQYNAIYAIHQNLYRLAEYTTPEATYEKKIGTYHYLDFSVTKNLQIGLFEGNLWQRIDSLGSHEPDYLFLNPVIFLNTAAKGFESSGFKSILGINASYSFGQNRLYGQAIFDSGELGGYQVGFKFFDLFTRNLDGGIEFNHVELNTYLTANKRYNYSHNNLPLAHPLVNGFNELTVNLGYQHNRFFVTNRLTYSQRLQNDSLSIGNNILEPSSSIESELTRSNSVLYNQIEIGYRFNKTNNLQFFIGHLYRNQTQPTNTPLTNYAYVGLRTRLKNKYLDF